MALVAAFEMRPGISDYSKKAKKVAAFGFHKYLPLGRNGSSKLLHIRKQ